MMFPPSRVAARWVRSPERIRRLLAISTLFIHTSPVEDVAAAVDWHTADQTCGTICGGPHRSPLYLAPAVFLPHHGSLGRTESTATRRDSRFRPETGNSYISGERMGCPCGNFATQCRCPAS